MYISHVLQTLLHWFVFPLMMLFKALPNLVTFNPQVTWQKLVWLNWQEKVTLGVKGQLWLGRPPASRWVGQRRWQGSFTCRSGPAGSGPAFFVCRDAPLWWISVYLVGGRVRQVSRGCTYVTGETCINSSPSTLLWLAPH